MPPFITEIDLGGCCVTPQNVAYVIDKLIESGLKKSDIRISVGRVQLRCLHHAVWSMADNFTLRYETEHGTPAGFLFSGVSVALEESLGDTDIRFDRMGIIDIAGWMRGCAIPAIDFNAKGRQPQ